ncbi:MAG: hypothetical protein AAGA56_11150, partial [Myxococcota bacterium]
AWLGKLGVFHIGDLARVDRKKLLSRIARRTSKKPQGAAEGTRAAVDLLRMIDGEDDVPLVAFSPPRQIVEYVGFDDEIEGLEPLRFVLRGLVGRASARLRARGEACGRIALRFELDPAPLQLKQRNERTEEGANARKLVRIHLPLPLFKEEELMQTLWGQLERLVLEAPVQGVGLRLDKLGPQRTDQLVLAHDPHASPAQLRHENDPQALPLLITELSALVGEDRVGCLRQEDSHLPERRSRLVPVADTGPPSPPPVADGIREPVRLLSSPIDLGEWRPQTRSDEHDALRHAGWAVERRRLVARLADVEWWGEFPIHRDYLRVVLRSVQSVTPTSLGGGGLVAEASIYLEHSPNEQADAPRAWLHGWYE